MKSDSQAEYWRGHPATFDAAGLEARLRQLIIVAGQIAEASSFVQADKVFGKESLNHERRAKDKVEVSTPCKRSPCDRCGQCVASLSEFSRASVLAKSETKQQLKDVLHPGKGAGFCLFKGLRFIVIE